MNTLEIDLINHTTFCDACERNVSSEEIQQLAVLYSNKYTVFLLACEYCKDLETIKWIYNLDSTIDISKDNDECFRVACQFNLLPVVQWLLQIKPNINISANNNEAFQRVCDNHDIDIGQWLLQIKPDVDILEDDYDKKFQQACDEGNESSARWFNALYPTKYIIICINYYFLGFITITIIKYQINKISNK